MWKVSTKKWLTSHIEREHKSSESKPNTLEKPNMFAKNNRTLLFGQS